MVGSGCWVVGAGLERDGGARLVAGEGHPYGPSAVTEPAGSGAQEQYVRLRLESVERHAAFDNRFDVCAEMPKVIV